MTTQKVLVSACLLGQRVRYDGKHNLVQSSLIDKLQSEGRLVPACPEVLGGLPVPRIHSSIEQQFPIKITNLEGDDVTPEFLAGAEAALEIAKRENCVAALMKADSPSCGNTDIKATSFSGRVTVGAGVAAQELIKAGIPVFNENQLDKLEELLLQLEPHALDESA